MYQVRGESLGNVTFIETVSGYIVIDPLTTVETAKYALNLLFEQVGKKPIVGMIYSHSHSDHFGGVKGMISEEEVNDGRIKVIASEGFTEWVLKEQGMVAEGMPPRNDYMYGENLEVSPYGIVDTGLGQMIEGGEITYIEPTDIIGKEGKKLTIDSLEIEFKFAPGEAPTGMHCYIPKYKTLHIADNCYMCLHNVYTIRGAFPRDAMQWSDSVAQSLSFKDTEFLISGHNWPVFGKNQIKEFLGQQRDGIKYMHDQTLRLMSHGYIPSEIANKIEFPPSLSRLWHLRGYYGTLKHNVQGIYSYYLGWYDGNPSNLDILPPRDLERKNEAHVWGGSVTYQRRYSIKLILGLETDMDNNMEIDPEEPAKPQKRQASVKPKQNIAVLANAAIVKSTTVEKLAEHEKTLASRFEEGLLSRDQYNKLIDLIATRRKALTA